MALDAVHIRDRNRTPETDELGSAVWRQVQTSRSLPHATHERRSLSPPPRLAHTTEISGSSTNPRFRSQDDDWQLLRTGESLANKALRIRPRFVRATHLSDPSLPAPASCPPAPEKRDLGPQQLEQTMHDPTYASSLQCGSVVESVTSSVPTLGQLYSQLAQEVQVFDQAQPGVTTHTSVSSVQPRSTRSPNISIKRDPEESHRHAHRHRHHPDARQRSEWFITKALTKMRRNQHTSPSDATPSALPSASLDSEGDDATQEKIISPSNRRRCPRCGDLLPRKATAEDMARHRQSIDHRLGLNALVSSASASEAPSPVPSEASTPTPRSRSTSPDGVSLLEDTMQALHRNSSRLPRRLSNAPRWKKIARDNVGHNLLSRMGWKEGMGLGVQEWKWQQLRREKLKRQRSNAVRALLRSQRLAAQDEHRADAQSDPFGTESSAIGTSDVANFSTEVQGQQITQPEPEWMQYLLQRGPTAPAAAEESSLQIAFPFQYDATNPEQQREVAQLWLANLAGSDAEWFQCLTMEEQQALEQALLSGQISLFDIRDVLVSSTQGHHDSDAPIATTEAIPEAMNSTAPANALLYPVQVELRTGRSGIGSKRLFSESEAQSGHRRRSRDAEGSVEIRRPTSPTATLPDAGRKRRRSISADRPPKPLNRSRSHSSTRKKPTELSRKQREQAYQRDKQEWLDLRASLS